MNPFTHLDDEALDLLTKQIARDAFRARTPADRARNAADYRAALDEARVRTRTAYLDGVRRILGDTWADREIARMRA